ncbi:MAG: type II secretion system GspH family protein [Phycisphaerales bacterium]|nr:type II secretion system GspH family protein [Phycisphaerales bacterium]
MHTSATTVKRRGFTMVEIIVVCTVLAMLLSVLAVRLTSMEGRNFDTVVEQTGDLMMMFALRSEHARQPVGLLIDEDRNSLRLLRREPSERAENMDLWQPDPTVREVRLPEFMSTRDIEVFVDGDIADLTEWPLSAMPGEDRPVIELVLRHQDRSVSLNLSPTSMSPRRIEEGRDEVPLREPEDLDNTGRWQEEW